MSEPILSIIVFCKIIETPIALINCELLEPVLIDLKAVNSIKAPKIPEIANDIINEIITFSFKIEMQKYATKHRPYKHPMYEVYKA